MYLTYHGSGMEIFCMVEGWVGVEITNIVVGCEVEWEILLRSHTCEMTWSYVCSFVHDLPPAYYLVGTKAGEKCVLSFAR